MRARLSYIFAVSLLICTISYAADRPLPANAKTGLLTVSANRGVAIDEKGRRLTAGAQIRDQKNLLVQPQTLITQLARLRDVEVPVLYTENNHGHVHRIWILTKEEMKRYPIEEEDKEPSPSGKARFNRIARP